MDKKLDIMISFVIIGRNEEKNLRRCITSIYNAIGAAGIETNEVIYVDASSEDRSVEIAHSFPEVKVFKVLGGRNAAVGRNIGAKEASGNVIFFVDGDMEVYEQFLVNVWNSETKSINEDIVAGQWLDIVGTERRKRKMSTTFPGGCFLIKRSVWEMVGGMKTRYKTGEESELGLRLMKKGVFFKRKDEYIINHYTVPYLEGSRIWKSIWTRYIFYSRCVLYRNHLFNGYMYPLMWTLDKTFLLLTVSIIASIVFFPLGLLTFILYLAAVVLRVARNKIYLPFPEMVGYYVISDTLNLVYFFTFFPKDIKLEYVAVPRS